MIRKVRDSTHKSGYRRTLLDVITPQQLGSHPERERERARRKRRRRSSIPPSSTFCSAVALLPTACFLLHSRPEGRGRLAKLLVGVRFPHAKVILAHPDAWLLSLRLPEPGWVKLQASQQPTCEAILHSDSLGKAAGRPVMLSLKSPAGKTEILPAFGAQV